jgi:hypothetical protein
MGFIVTNLMWYPAERVVNFYNQRGTARQWIKEGKYAVKWTRLSWHDFVVNQVPLQLFALAYNLGNFLRKLALPEGVEHWSVTTLREKLVKIGAKVVRRARYVVFHGGGHHSAPPLRNDPSPDQPVMPGAGSTACQRR